MAAGGGVDRATWRRSSLKFSVYVSFMDDSIRVSKAGEILSFIRVMVDNSAIPWWTRRLTLSMIPSFTWSAGDMEKKESKARASNANSSRSQGDLVAT